MEGATTVIEFLVAIAIAFIPVSIIMGVVSAIKASDEENSKKKKDAIWRMVLYFTFPFILLFIIVAVWGAFYFFIYNKFV